MKFQSCDKKDCVYYHEFEIHPEFSAVGVVLTDKEKDLWEEGATGVPSSQIGLVCCMCGWFGRQNLYKDKGKK